MKKTETRKFGKREAGWPVHWRVVWDQRRNCGSEERPRPPGWNAPHALGRRSGSSAPGWGIAAWRHPLGDYLSGKLVEVRPLPPKWQAQRCLRTLPGRAAPHKDGPHSTG